MLRESRESTSACWRSAAEDGRIRWAGSRPLFSPTLRKFRCRIQIWRCRQRRVGPRASSLSAQGIGVSSQSKQDRARVKSHCLTKRGQDFGERSKLMQCQSRQTVLDALEVTLSKRTHRVSDESEQGVDSTIGLTSRRAVSSSSVESGRTGNASEDG